MIFERIEKVEIRSVSKRYGDSYAVRDLTLEVEGGELLVLIGPSGSGKTTTLRMINRLIEPDSGEILINDSNILDFDPVELRRSIGYVIQQIGLFPHMKVGENIAIIPKLEGWPEDRIKRRVSELLRLVDLPEDFADRHPRQLSGGQQQRVGLARALATNPPLLLMDEPFGALDPILRKQLQEEFAKIKEEVGRTIVFVTHDIEEAFHLGDRIAIMHNGKLIQVGTAEELILNPKNDFVEDITGSKRMFRHLDNLRVGDMMLPVEKKYLIPDIDVEEAIRCFRERGTELAFLDAHSVVFLKDLIGIEEGGVRVSDVAREVKSFKARESLVSALTELKRSGEFVAAVEDGGKISGILLAQEVLMKLI